MHGMLYSCGPIFGLCSDLKGSAREYYNATCVQHIRVSAHARIYLKYM